LEELVREVSRKMKENDCVFCRIVRREAEASIILDTGSVMVFPTIRPMSQGHCLIIPYEHYTRMHDIPDDTIHEIVSIIKKIAVSMNLESYTVLQNNGGYHVHFHLIPREDNEPNLDAPRTNPSRRELDSIADNIRQKLR